MPLFDAYIPSVQPGQFGMERSEYRGGLAEMFESKGRVNTDYSRPYLDKNGNPAVTINTGRTTLVKGEQMPIKEHRLIRDLAHSGIFHPVWNATSLRKEEWNLLDRKVLRAARFRLRAWADLANSNTFGGFNGMAKTELEHEVMTDPGEAIVDMDGLTPGRNDAPIWQLRGMPLPITHSDFWYSRRKLEISRNSSTPLDMTMGEAAGRRIGETLEKTTIGIQTGITYGGNATQVGGYDITSAVYGYLNYPNRLTKTGLYKPTLNGRSGTGWVAGDTLKDVLACLDQLRNQKFFGPFTIYHSNDWDQYLDGDYILTGGNVATQTLRQRLRAVEGITDVKRLDMLFASTPSASTGPGGENLANTYPFTMIFVQMSEDVCRAVIGMDITTVQWPSQGDMRLNFKAMAIMVPQIRSDAYGNSGVLQATFSA